MQTAVPGNEAAAAGNQDNTAPTAQNNGQADAAAQNTDNTTPAPAAQTPAENPDNVGQQAPEIPQQ